MRLSGQDPVPGIDCPEPRDNSLKMPIPKGKGRFCNSKKSPLWEQTIRDRKRQGKIVEEGQSKGKMREGKKFRSSLLLPRLYPG